MKIKSKSLLVSFLLYCGILFLGMFVIYVVQYHYHSDLADTTAQIAKELSETGKIATENEHFHGCIFFVEKDEAVPVPLYLESEPLIYENFVTDFITYHHSSQSLYQLIAELHPLTFFAIASSPVCIGGQFAGNVYAAHTISYLPSIIYTFLFLCTFIYCLLFMHLCFIQKINQRITSIYRKYIANISHELKSPIASIHAITETLNAGLAADEETLHKYYGIIDRESHRLEQSVLDIIELSKIQDQRIDVSKKMTPIYDILIPISKRYKDFCEDVGIHFSVDASVRNLPDLYTNADRIIQLMQILLDNAMKFTSEGGRISIHAECDSKQVILCISDTGCGMDEETISHIFERFYRGTNTSEYAGSGLGLSIAKELVYALNERIWASSELGVGTNFYFTIARKKRR